jgi:hypothetical protein
MLNDHYPGKLNQWKCEITYQITCMPDIKKVLRLIEFFFFFGKFSKKINKQISKNQYINMLNDHYPDKINQLQ